MVFFTSTRLVCFGEYDRFRWHSRLDSGNARELLCETVLHVQMIGLRYRISWFLVAGRVSGGY